MRTTFKTLTFVIAISSSYAISPLNALAEATAKDMCAIYAKSAVIVEPDKALKMRELSKEAKEVAHTKWACVQSYGQQFPGGLDAMKAAKIEDLQSNLKVLRTYFDKRARFVAIPDGDSKDDRVRKIHIEDGWDREQVILWGTYFLLRQAYSDANYDLVLIETEKIRKEFGLKVARLEYWDKVQGATYFSPQALRNMIVGLEYATRAKKPGNTRKDAARLAQMYMADRDAIAPLAAYGNNPDAVVLRAVCR